MAIVLLVISTCLKFADSVYYPSFLVTALIELIIFIGAWLYKKLNPRPRK